MDDVLLVPKGAGAEGMRERPPLLGVGHGIADSDDARLVGLVPFVLEEPLLAVGHMAVYITVRLWRRKGQGVGADADNIAWAERSVCGSAG